MVHFWEETSLIPCCFILQGQEDSLFPLSALLPPTSFPPSFLSLHYKEMVNMGGGWVKRWKFLGETNKFNHLVSFTFEEFPFPFRFLFSAPLSRRAWWGQVLASEYQRLHYFTTCVTQWVNIQDGIGGSFAHSKKFKATSKWSMM